MAITTLPIPTRRIDEILGERVGGLVADLFQGGTHSGASITVNADGTISITVTDVGGGATLDEAQVRSVVAGMVDPAGSVTAVYDEAAGKLTFTGAGEVFTAQASAKLAGIATGATANDTDAALRDRKTHNGEQAIGTVTGLQAIIDAFTSRLEEVEGAVLTGGRVVDGVLHLDRQDGGTISATIDPLPQPGDVAPSFTVLPSLSGSTALGGTITVDFGTATGTPTPTLTGTLTRPGQAAAATTDGATFTVAASDQGGTVHLSVTAQNSGSATATTSLPIPAAEAVPLPSGYRALQDYNIDKALTYNWGSSTIEIFLPNWFNGVHTYADPSKIDYNADKSVTLNGAIDPATGNWLAGTMQYQRPKKAKGKWGAVVSSDHANAVNAFFTYSSTGKELDFELTEVNGVPGWAPAVHMPVISGGRVSSTKRTMARGTFTPGVPQLLAFELFSDRCEFSVDGVIFETITPADMADGGTWDTTTEMVVMLSVEKHDAWAGWDSTDYAKGSRMTVYSMLPVGAAPAQVAGVTATVNGTSATITWTAPADNGSAIQDYTIRIDGTIVADGTGTGTTYTATGLSGGTHTVTVAAVNGNGEGPQSAAASFDIVAPAEPLPLWPLDEGSGTTVTADSGATGTLVGPTWAASPTRIVVNNNYGTIPYTTDETPAQAVVVGAIVRLPAVSGTRAILARDSNPAHSARYWWLLCNNGNLATQTFVNTAGSWTGTLVETAGMFVADEWVMVTAVIGSTSTTHRKNGTEVGTHTHPARFTSAADAPIIFGGMMHNTTPGTYRNYLNGDMAAFGVIHGGDVAALEAQLLAVASDKGITLSGGGGGGQSPSAYQPDMTTGRIAVTDETFGGRENVTPARYYEEGQDEMAVAHDAMDH